MSLELNDLKSASALLETEWFDNYFFGYYSNYGDFHKNYLRKKRFRLSDEKLPSRVLNHWIKEGVFKDDREDKKGWRTFSITEVMLITIIKRLRSFGMSLSKIKKMRECIDIYNNLDKNSSCLLLDFYISYGQISKEPVQLIVLEDGESIIVRQEILNEMLQLGVLIDYITIDLNAMLSRGLNSKINMTKYTPSEVEKEFKNHIKNNDLLTMNIKFKNDEFHLTKEHLMKDKKSAEGLMNILQYATHNSIKTGNKPKHIVKEQKKIKKEEPYIFLKT